MAIFPTFFFFGNIRQENVFFDILQRKNAFLGYKNKNFKKSKNSHFSKKVNPWFLSKNGLFFNFFFSAIQARKMSCMIFQNAKTLFQAIKTRISKTRKIDIFAKGLTMVQVQKWPFFNLFFLGNIGQENLFYGILQRKIPSLGYKNIKFKKSKIDIFPWFWSHNGHFSNFLGGAIQAKKMSFMIFQNEKKLFQAIKTTSLKSRKIVIFPKGLTHRFGIKNGHFFNFFFQEIQARKMSFMIFYNEKSPFQAIKTRSSKSRKIDIFPKGLTHGFGQKMAIFPFFFRQYRPGKCLI